MQRKVAAAVAAALLGAAPAARAQSAGAAGVLVAGGDPAQTGSAQGGGTAVSAGILTGRPTVGITRAAEAPRIDGRLDDPIWRGAARITQFVQQRPVEGEPATEQTEVYIAYDSQNLYFGIHAHYSDTGLIRANRVDRDQSQGDDAIRFYFDPFLDQQRAYVLAVNAYGVQSDAILNSADAASGWFGQLAPRVITRTDGLRATIVNGRTMPVTGGGFWERLKRRIVPQNPENHTSGGRRSSAPGDSSWDALFDSAGTMVDDGWTAEMAIPFKSLRYPSRAQGEPHRWGFQIERTIDSKDESVVWAPISRSVMGQLTQMGVLEGMTDLSTSRNLEFLPTFSGFNTDAVRVIPAGHEGHSHEHTLGEVGGHSEGAMNVKYGLTSDLVFDFTYNPDFSQIESDRPQIEVNQRFPVFYAELRPFFLEGQDIYQVQAPFPLSVVHTRTLVDPRYGAKLTGRVGRASIGFMVANDEAPGRVDDPQSPLYDQTAKVTLGRVRYDLYSESHLGAIVTDREFLDGHSRLGGVDGAFRFGRNHRFTFTALNSDRLGADGTRATGSLLDFTFQRESRHLVYNVAHNEIHPEFGTDLGFVRRVDQKQSTASVGYRWWPESWLINWEPRIQYERNYDYQDVLQDERIYGRLNFQFANNISLYSNLVREMERYREIDFWKSRASIGGTINTSRSVSFNFSMWNGDQIRFIDNPYLGSDQQVNLLVNVRPLSRLQTEVGLNTSRFTDVRTDREVFNVKIWRMRTTYQFTNRMLLRKILEYNSFDRTVGGNVLLTYRVNAGTVFFLGYDDHYMQGDRIDAMLYPTTSMLRTNRAIFMKVQYLFRY